MTAMQAEGCVHIFIPYIFYSTFLHHKLTELEMALLCTRPNAFCEYLSNSSELLMWPQPTLGSLISYIHFLPLQTRAPRPEATELLAAPSRFSPWLIINTRCSDCERLRLQLA